jgi:hypothetical protein
MKYLFTLTLFIISTTVLADQNRAAQEAAFIAAAKPWAQARFDLMYEVNSAADAAITIRRNPGKREAIREIYKQYDQCRINMRPVFLERVLQTMATHLPEKLFPPAMNFFASPDAALSVKLDTDAVLTPAQQARLDSIKDKYPYDELVDALFSANMSVMTRNDPDRVCMDDFDKAMKQGEIK